MKIDATVTFILMTATVMVAACASPYGEAGTTSTPRPAPSVGDGTAPPAPAPPQSSSSVDTTTPDDLPTIPCEDPTALYCNNFEAINALAPTRVDFSPYGKAPSQDATQHRSGAKSARLDLEKSGTPTNLEPQIGEKTIKSELIVSFWWMRVDDIGFPFAAVHTTTEVLRLNADASGRYLELLTTYEQPIHKATHAVAPPIDRFNHVLIKIKRLGDTTPPDPTKIRASIMVTVDGDPIPNMDGEQIISPTIKLVEVGINRYQSSGAKIWIDDLVVDVK